MTNANDQTEKMSPHYVQKLVLSLKPNRSSGGPKNRLNVTQFRSLHKQTRYFINLDIKQF